MPATELVGALAAIIAVLQEWRSLTAQKRARRADAIRALSEAVTATQQVVGQRKTLPPRMDYALTQLWRSASIAFREAGEEELADLCRVKGNYWRAPSRWSAAVIRAAGIQLTAMQRELQRLQAS